MGLANKIRSVFVKDIGIDLGTANSLVFVRDQGIVLNEPSVVAVHEDTGKALAVGIEAKKMLGRTPGSIRAIRPMKDGVIADFDITEIMLRYFINKVHSRARNLTMPRVLIAVPSGINEVEMRAVKESAKKAGAGEVETIFEPMAAAIGVGLPVADPTGNMVVDIGGGTTEVAMISLAGIVESKSVKVGGDAMDMAITNHIKNNYNLKIGPRMAEEIKITLGSAFPLEEGELTMEVRGNDQLAGLPKAITITSTEIREALMPPVTSIAESVRQTLDRCPPELSADLIDHGIYLAGGGALLRGLDKLLRQETGLPVTVADDPLCAVANGTGSALQNMDTLFRNSQEAAKRNKKYR
jgi:rod shape-determining protein MreB